MRYDLYSFSEIREYVIRKVLLIISAELRSESTMCHWTACAEIEKHIT